jgi:hypothetical protein
VLWRRKGRATDRGVPKGFDRALQAVERAKRSLVAAVPSPRGVPPVPLAEALHGFEIALRLAGEEMAGWRSPGTEDDWRVCRDALDRSSAGAERLRLKAPDLDYESLVAALGDLIAPLDAFEDAHDRLRRVNRF